MLKIRLTRQGSKKRPFYHIVVADSRAPRDGRYIERLGRYNPLLPQGHAERLVLVDERVKYWLAQGAEPTDRLARFFGQLGLIAKRAIPVNTLKSQPKKKAQERAAAEKDRLEKLAADAKAAAEAKVAEAQAAAEAKAAAEAAPAEAPAEAPAAEEAAPEAPAE